jgi:hypothetical protein
MIALLPNCTSTFHETSSFWTLAAIIDGGVEVWDGNGYGQIGNGTTEPYLYASDNPLDMSDPTGLSLVSDLEEAAPYVVGAFAVGILCGQRRDSMCCGSHR